MSEWNGRSSQMEEGYWRALLQEGEFAASAGKAPLQGVEVLEGLAQDRVPSDGRTAPPDDVWEAAQEIFENNGTLELEATGYNRGGLLVTWRGLQGFVPASHLIGFSPWLSEEERRAELARRVGQRLTLRIIELDPARWRFVLSERITTEEIRRREALLAEITPGEVREGIVTNLTSFGAFVDLGGVEGLIHISELSWGRVEHPRDVLKRGQRVRVYVLNVDRERERIGLSLKRLLPDPWETVEERYHPGQLVEGVITNVVSFGAFARLEEGLEGLIHISELAEGTFLHPRNVVREGERVTARVLSVSRAERRIALSLRQVDKPDGWWAQE